MQRLVLLDSQLLILALDATGQDAEKITQAKAKLINLLQDDRVKLCITPLIRYEVMRGLKNRDNSHISAVLSSFMMFDIKENIGKLAADLFHHSKMISPKEPLVDKRSFDVFHFVSAQCYELDLETWDKDFNKIERVYQSWKNYSTTKKLN